LSKPNVRLIGLLKPIQLRFLSNYSFPTHVKKLTGRQPATDFCRQALRLRGKNIFPMQSTRFRLYLAVCLLVLIQVFCKENPLETVESRDESGQLERYQRRKTDFAKEGLYQKFALDGRLLEEAHYLNDTLDGERKYFFPDGKTESIENYRRGQYHGKYQKFYESGQLFVEQEFVNGAMQGKSLRYYPNGVLQEKVSIRDNVENGPFWEYWENGNLKTEGTYLPNEEESLEQGELKEYDENGQLVRIADCDKGICTTRWKK